MPKNIQYLSKRRKNQLLHRELHRFRHRDEINIESNVLNVIPNTEIEREIKRVQEATSVSQNTEISSNTNHVSFQHSNECCQLPLHSDSIANSDDEYCQLSVVSDSNSASSDVELQPNVDILIDHSNDINKTTLWQDIQTLIIEHRISHNTGNELLRILKRHGHAELPNDVRILLGTPRNSSMHMTSVARGHYIHFGLSSSLEYSIQIYSNIIRTNEIKLNINIDGLPLSKSSGSQFWPIMASIENVPVYTLPFIIGVYHGMCKPTNVNEFLSPFVNEFLLLSKNGITVYNVKYSIAIHAILCDAPARAFVTCTKGHAGYFSCSKCIQEGEFIGHKVVFPETINNLRTDNSFKNRTQKEHHLGDFILEQLPLGMVSQIPLDYMHLVCLGVMKRLLQFWIKGRRNVRLSMTDVESVSQRINAIKNCIPSEFKRKPRGLHDVDRWKATEFRQFLLYTGIIIMKPILSSVMYNHFLCLSIAIRILIDSELCIQFNNYANSLLVSFVSNYGNIYGDEYLSYNVHNLIHLAQDVQTFGSLSNINCFKYENHMQKIKRQLHNSGKPLQELSNRLFEESRLPLKPYRVMQYPYVVYDRNNDISYVQFRTFKITRKNADNCALLDDHSLIIVVDIFEQDSVVFIRARRFLNPCSFFSVPCESTRLGIYVISSANVDILTVPITQIKYKCLKIQFTDEADTFVTIPLLHTNE